MKRLVTIAMVLGLLALTACDQAQFMADIKTGAVQDCQSDYSGNVEHRDACVEGVVFAVNEGLNSFLLSKPTDDKVAQAVSNAKSRCEQKHGLFSLRTRNACKQGVENAETQLKRLM